MAETTLTKNQFTTKQKRAAARFWSRVHITVNPDECWEWTGFRFSKGYGYVNFPEIPTQMSHRIAYFLATGVFPICYILHSCDNPPCCNPRHLRDGTQSENIQEASAKGRLKNQARRSLTDADALEIYHQVKNGKPKRALAREYNVPVEIIRGMVCQRTYRHLNLTPLIAVTAHRRGV